MALGTVWALGTWDVGAWADGTWDDASAANYGDQADGQQPIYALTDVTGLTKWTDYWPAEYVPYIEAKKNTTDDDGFMWVLPLGSVTGLRAWEHYIPVYIVDGPEVSEGRFDEAGYVPIAES